MNPHLIIRKVDANGIDAYELYDSEFNKVIAVGRELALTKVSPTSDKYLYGAKFIQGYRYVSPNELYKLAKEKKQIFTSLEKINNKIIIEWTN